jgi:hypothetical protein
MRAARRAGHADTRLYARPCVPTGTTGGALALPAVRVAARARRRGWPRAALRTLKWEGSSNAVPDAIVDHFCRALDVLKAEELCPCRPRFPI